MNEKKLANSKWRGDKNNNAFTLIELLAIIVILAIIAVITIPILLNVIENSRKGTSIDSAYGYKESVQQFYISKAVNDHTEQAPSGYKKVSSLITDGLLVSGETPTDGWVKLDKGQVIDYSLKFGEYVVSYNKTTNTAVSVKNGEIGPMPAAKLYSESNNTLTKKDKSQMQVGDIVVLETETLQEKFIVLNDTNAPTGTTALLAVNNLNVGSSKNSSLPEGFQGDENSYYPVAFAGSQYWEEYATNIYNPEKDYLAGTDYSVAYYVNNYVTNLKNAGFTGVDSGRILTYSEVRTDTNPVGIASSDLLRISGKPYWLSSADYSNRVWFVSQNGGTSSIIYTKSTDFGVRPLIYINTNDIE